MAISDLHQGQPLTALLGRECRYLERHWRIIDLLVEEQALVLESAEMQPGIQLDQFGRPSYRAPDLLQVSIRGLGAEELPDDLRVLAGDWVRRRQGSSQVS